jgi:hypothetical protein
MKRVMAIGFALLLLTVVAAQGLYAQQAGQQDSQTQQSGWVCPRTGQPCPMGGQGHMHRGGRGMRRGQGVNCPMAGQNCPYYSQSKSQAGSQTPAASDTKPAKQ